MIVTNTYDHKLSIPVLAKALGPKFSILYSYLTNKEGRKIC